MSIVKNNTSYDSVDYTIKRLSTVPTQQGLELPIIQYVHLTSAYYRAAVAKAGINLIRARIPSTALGYLFGYGGGSDSSADNMFIRVEEQSGSKVVVWNLGGTTIGSVPLDGDHFHEYGFVGGYAVYDYQKVNPSQAAPSLSGYMLANICGANLNGGNRAISEVYLARVDVHSFVTQIPESYETPYLCRFYPTSGNDGYIYNALRLVYEKLTPSTLTGGSIEGGPVLTEPYGIQLDDIRYLTRLGYIDALALICADGGVDVRAGQSSPESAYSAIAGHYFAFDLRNTRLPDGSFTPNPSTSLPDRRGKLLKGRKPNWDIWNDSVAHGFYIMNDNGVKTLMFNIFKNADGSDISNVGEVVLEWFDGYNTAESASHPPTFIISDKNAVIQFHNGQNYRCTEESIAIASRWDDEIIDHQCLFYVENVADLDYKAKLGNAIPWNIPQAKLGQDYGIYGGGVSIKIDGEVYASSAEREDTIICADTYTPAQLAGLKQKYRENGISGVLLLNYIVPSLCIKLLNATGNILNGVATMSLIGRNGTYLMPEFCGETPITLQGLFNTTIEENPLHTITNKRQFVGEWLKNGNSTKYMAYFCTNLRNNNQVFFEWWTYGGTEFPDDPKCLVLAAQECNAEGTQLIEDANSTFYAMAIMEIADSTHPNRINRREVCMVPGIRNIALSSTPPKREGTNEHVAWNHAYASRQLGHFYKGGIQVGESHSSVYTNFFVAGKADFGFTTDDMDSFTYNNANLRFDVFRSDLSKALAKYGDGAALVPNCESTSWVHGTSMTSNTPIFIHRLPDETLNTSNGLVCNTFMRKFRNTLESPSKQAESGWVAFNEGPDAGQSAPSFVGTIKVYKKDILVDYATRDAFPAQGETGKLYRNLYAMTYFIWNGSDYELYSGGPSRWSVVATFTYDGSESWGTPSSVSPREYPKITKTDGNYTCDLYFKEAAAPFNHPNGYPETLGNSGYLWYYNIQISTSNTISAMDTFKIEME